MSLRFDILPYLDPLGYVVPHASESGLIRQSDNSLMFTSEFFLLLALRKEDRERDADEWKIFVEKCSVVPGLLDRYPRANEIDSPDNMIGVLAASKVLKVPEVAREILSYGLHHGGYFNLTGKFSWSGFLWRQPQLFFAALCASGVYHWLWPLVFPLALYSALVIATAGKNAKGETDPWRLSYLLILATREDSWVCRLTSKIWLKRLMRTHANGFVGVCEKYYGASHPIAAYQRKDGWLAGLMREPNKHGWLA